ncbi:MAG: hypothetical protein M5U07_19955 [Xanthobacteraceae bacterium]|nr:hypothetical protein [Xanthobacteraceae bacterium]
MTDTSRTIAETFYAASAARDVETIARLLADDVDWMVRARSTCSRSSASAGAARRCWRAIARWGG